jgi:D-3-phosphoglycerate dehydrogenase
MKNNHFYVIDFDTTFVTVDALEELARIVLKSRPDRNGLLDRIKHLTQLEKEGEISYQDSLAQRTSLFFPNRKHIKTLVTALNKQISPSFARNKHFFKEYGEQIYIVSSGFKEYIAPVVATYGISESHVLANTFIFDDNGDATGYDENNLLSQNQGKVKAVQALRLQGEVYAIGARYSDYQIKERSLAKAFFAYTENVRREGLVKLADYEAPDFDEFLYRLKLPRSQSYPKSRMKVLLLEKIDQRAAEYYEKQGYDVITYDRAMGEEELINEIKNVSIIGIRSKTELTEEVLNNANRLLSIGAFCIGTNQINLEAATRKGIAVFNAPYSNTRSVVELTIGEIIMLSRDVFDKSQKMHRGVWEKSAEGSREIRGKKLGLIGYGNIGSQLSVLAESLGLDVYFYDIVDKLALGNAKACRSLDELLEIADIVSVHVDGRKSNNNIISTPEFKMMKQDAIFINASRGSVVDLKALVKALKDKSIKGAAVDVFPEEPKSNRDPFVSELQGLPNVILTPHIAGSTIEAQQNIADFVSNKLSNYVDNGDTTLSVNFPNINLPTLLSGHRLIHVHQNVPGILARINSIMANNNLNIIGQYLKTNEEIGYVITDVSSTYSDKVVQELVSIPNTIKFRVLF